MLRAPRNILRLIAIAWTLARHDALFPLERFGIAPPVTALARLVALRRRPGRPGQRLAQAVQELGPSFIKFGQLLSTRSDLLGEEVASDLSGLQDHLPPFPGAEARRIVERELGQPLDALYTSFEDVPVAAASIAQVHMAITADGREVAVKVLRPGIEDAFDRDIDLFYWLAALAEWTQPSLRRLRPVDVVRTLAESVAIEMDLRFETAAATEIKEKFDGDPSLHVPGVDWVRTSRRVLTLERIEGIPIDEREALLAAGHDLEAIITKAAAALFNQAFRDGFFHADLHPGNLFVNAQGDIVAVDFGIMGRLDRHTRYYLVDMLAGFLTGDYRRAAEAHFKAGYVPATKSLDAFTQACRSIAEPILGKPMHEISIARLLAQLFQVAKFFEMETQPQLLLLQKSMLVAEGVGRTLNPDVNMWELARPLIEEWARENRGPEARLREAATEVAESLGRIPSLLGDAEKALAMVSDGGLRLHPDTVRALAEQGRDGNRSWLWALWIAVALIAVIAVAVV